VEITRVQVPPLVRASQHGDIAEIRELISKGENVKAADSSGFTPLMNAVVTARDAVPELLAAGATVNAKDTVEGVTALTIAYQRRKNLQAGKALVNHGANINAMSKYGQTPLMTAATSCLEPLVSYLLQRGANMAEKNARRSTALIPAVASGCADVAKVLLETGAAR
jgi:ankyrin repeat protein